MNYEKIVQFVIVASSLGLLKFWISDQLDIEFFLIIVAFDAVILFVLWVIYKITETIKYKKNQSHLAKDEDSSIPASMMKIINKYSLTEPDDLSAGVLEISKFIINSISSNLNKANEQDAMFAKGVFFLCIYDVIAVKYSTEPSSPNSHNYLAGMLAMESSVESPGGLLEEIMDYVYSNELDGMTTNLISSMVSQFIDKPNKKFINNLESTFKSFKR